MRETGAVGFSALRTQAFMRICSLLSTMHARMYAEHAVLEITLGGAWGMDGGTSKRFGALAT